MTTPSIVAIVQARVGSTRCPGKVLAELEGVPLLVHVLRRACAVPMPMPVILAIPRSQENDRLAVLGETEGVRVYRGDEEDVLARFYWAAQLVPEALAIVRLTADDPFKDPELIETAAELFLQEWAHPRPEIAPPPLMHLGGVTWPLGLDVEVFTRAALERAFHEATDPYDREHVTPWMARTLGCYMIRNPWGRGTINDRWTIDTDADLAFARDVYRRLYPKSPTFGYQAMIAAGYA